MATADSDTKIRPEPSAFRFYCYLLLVFMLWIMSIFALPIYNFLSLMIPPGWRENFVQYDGPGEFGDQFGTVNALFSGLAFAGILYAISVQRYEVSLAKAELNRTKDILDQQTKQIEQQNLSSLYRDFDSVFFQMITTLNRIASEAAAFPSKYSTIPNKGRNAFRGVFEKMRETVIDPFGQEETDVRARLTFPNIYQHCTYSAGYIDRAYEEVYNENADFLGPYFRTLFNILEYIDTSEIPNKKRYANFLRAQLSEFEIAILFYNAHSRYGSRQMRPLVEKYSLLKNLEPKWILSEEMFYNGFERSAFSTRPTYLDETIMSEIFLYPQE